MDEKEQNISTYNNSAAGMADKFNNLGARVEDINRAFSFVNKENPKVLELGCGNGRDASEIIKRTNDYLGIDYSQGMIDLAMRTVPEAKFVVADHRVFEFPKNIDIIFSFASLLHDDKENIQKILDKCYNALNLNGIIYISLKHDEYRRFENTDKYGTRVYYYYTPELIQELAGDKFQTLYVDKQYVLEQNWFTIILQKHV